MESINAVLVTGNVVRTPATEDLVKVGETQKLTLTIAVNRSVKTNGEWVSVPSYFDVVVWGKVAAIIYDKAEKGSPVCVQGQLIQDRWEKDGQKKSRIYINAEKILLTGGQYGGKQASDNSGHTNQAEGGSSPEDPVF